MYRKSRFRDIEHMATAEAWASQIAERDSDYKDYAGADPETGQALALTDVFLYILPDRHPLKLLLKLDRLFLIQEKKAFFATSRAGEISVLGLLKGVKRIGYSARAKSRIPDADKVPMEPAT